MAKVVAKVLKPLVGKLPHHIQSTSDFVSKVRGVTLLSGEFSSSYDVTALFTSIPIDLALYIIKNLLGQDDTLCNRTVLSVQYIIELLGPIPFLDTLVKPEADDSLSITDYNKPTHTDPYLQWDSHHNLSAKYNVMNTLILGV